MKKKVRLAGLVAGLMTVALSMTSSPAVADDVSPSSYTNFYRFLQINTNGVLSEWTELTGQVPYYRVRHDWGWERTRLITGLSYEDFASGPRFLEINGDDLFFWQWLNEGLHVAHLDSGWGNVRLMAGVDTETFIAITYAGVLTKWQFQPGVGYRAVCSNSGWGETRLIAGLAKIPFSNFTHFLEVKGDELVYWTWSDSGCQFSLTRHHSDWGWRNARHVAGMTPYAFVEVKDNGELVEWNSTQIGNHTYAPTHVDWGWDNTKVMG